MIRTIITVLFVALYLILSSPYMVITYFWSKIDPKKGGDAALRNVSWAFRVVTRLSGMSPTVTGIENIPKDKAVLFVANHQSILDIPLTYPLMISQTGFISKDTINHVPLLRVWMRRLHCIFLDRKSPRAGLDMILKSIEYIKNGISIFIFPEGTRNKGNVDEIAEFKAGAVKMATKTGCPIIPIAIAGTRRVFEDHSPFMRYGKVRVAFGEPIIIENLDEESKKHLGDYCHDKVQELYNTIK
ncbi:MAG: 1-acyl-sn-glycerol-3-phosphate acyltransferase [Lachnospiraceae bacterium]|nr:1-acyl-sn-glycerol-3-phosphate acyltransferase [Lachnospiraceae bacterium]